MQRAPGACCSYKSPQGAGRTCTRICNETPVSSDLCSKVPFMTTSYTDATLAEVDAALKAAWQAFTLYKNKTLKERAQFLYAIAANLKAATAELIAVANRETHLGEARLGTELKRTIFQLQSYADACTEGTWLDIRIDTPDLNRQPPKPDLRKMLVPLGPVAVFGASNFPFAYSTAGGDTACALAAGCPVVLKAHPAHAGTSETVAQAVKKAARECGLPDGIFNHLHGSGFEVGQALVQHPLTKAVGFTGSFAGGKALFDLANQRPVPIPVFAEMGSVNPVFLLPQKLAEDAPSVASAYAASITQSAGQFCTNPGLLVGIEGAGLNQFKTELAIQMKRVAPAKMLHQGIAKSFRQKREEVLTEEGVAVLATVENEVQELESIPTLAEASGKNFLKNPLLHQEVFGPFSLLVTCKDESELLEIARALEGQLTTTIMATERELEKNNELVAALQLMCGRLIFNGVPTGVEPVLAMQHGGPFPATTDSRFTAVGPDGIKRFARPVCYQAWPDALLPDELKNNNPLGLWRTVNNALSREGIA
jgi:alpha-ketoglutaric semialdehyde dehydrogenase